MRISLEELAKGIMPNETVLFFGSGSSVPSGAPTSRELATAVGKDLGSDIDVAGYTLTEVASLAEQRHSRTWLIEKVRQAFERVAPNGGVRNMSLYDWKSLYTTNYDTVIERCYGTAHIPLEVFSSNFDFSAKKDPLATRLFKLHGTLDKDISDGHVSRLIITDKDYDHTEDYREYLFDTLKADVAGADIVIIGHSLADPDIKAVIERAQRINQQVGRPKKNFLLMYAKDLPRAEIYEMRGLTVAFGSIDGFFASLIHKISTVTTPTPTDGQALLSPALIPLTKSVTESVRSEKANVSAMYNGWPATFGDIAGGFTFSRTLAADVETTLQDGSLLSVVILGAGGVGKTTLAKQVLHSLNKRGVPCWEHLDDYPLKPDEWRDVARALGHVGQVGVLLVDDAHHHLYEVNSLVDQLAAESLLALKILLVSTQNHWSPRVKSPNLFRLGKTVFLSKLDENEVDALLQLVDSNAELIPLVENSFAGFSRHERRRRLSVRCDKDFFVCLKNIFSSEQFDDIILRDYATLAGPLQDVYRHVAALESSGVRVHRQLIIRLLGIPAATVIAILDGLIGMVQEYTINKNSGIYGWKGRHSVISEIITKYKYETIQDIFNLYDKVISGTLPTYEMEVRSLIELCTIENGIDRIPDKVRCNILLRKMISVIPGERVPRHRLIRNLIKMGEFEKAAMEIRLFEKDFKIDGPVYRYRILLLIERSKSTPGIMEEDRLAILEQAREAAATGINRYENRVDILKAYVDVAIEIYRRTGSFEVYDTAMAAMKEAEARIADPEITRAIRHYGQKITGLEKEAAV